MIKKILQQAWVEGYLCFAFACFVYVAGWFVSRLIYETDSLLGKYDE